MSEASDRLARSRLALVQHIQRKDRKQEMREEMAETARDAAAAEWEDDQGDSGPMGWIGRARRAVSAWWRYHPAHMAADIATPVLASYARRKPAQMLGIAAVAGAVLVFTRPWRLMSASALILAVLKSSHLPGLLMSVMQNSGGYDDEPDARRRRRR
ncbi:MAG: hypothetical protein V4864_00910 [Pseudomonadota bacterium]